MAIGGFTAIHNLFYESGFLYLADSSTPAVAIVDLTGFDPDDPPQDPITQTKWMVTDVGTVFVHDVTVARGRMYASAWDSGIWIYDVSNVANETPRFLGSGPGNNTHSSWPTDDDRYVVTGEERQGGGITVYRVVEGLAGDVTLEITDEVALPENEASSVHNQTIIGHRVYNSWYQAGLRVYDVDPVTGLLDFVANYDTPSAWGVYPFLGQDRVLVSDIQDGLYVIEVTAAFPCSEDLDESGDVGFGDLLQLLAVWGPCEGACPEDLDDSGDVDFGDLLQLLAAWGPCV